MSEPFVGEIRAFGFDFAPQGWLQCNGQTLAISQYAALFSLLGTTYGGNGTTNFQLPNLQGRVAIGQGNGAGLSPYVMGQAAGTENVSLATAQIPSHTHAVNAVTTTNNNVASPSGAYPASPTADPRGTTVNPYSPPRRTRP